MNSRLEKCAASCRRAGATSATDRPTSIELRAAATPIETEIGRYLADLKAGMTADPKARSSGHDNLAEEIYSILTDRQFSHVSRGRAAACREQTLLLLSQSLRRGGPIPFWYDIGPGYHASIGAGALAPSFEVGLSEWLVLHQIACFSQRVAGVYAPGVRFSLVVDNLCALRTNDIPVEHTQRYCSALRALIRERALSRPLTCSSNRKYSTSRSTTNCSNGRTIARSQRRSHRRTWKMSPDFWDGAAAARRRQSASKCTVARLP